MEITKSMEQLVDGLALLGMSPEFITLILGICNTKDKQIKMMLIMATKIDNNENITEEDLLEEAIKIAQA